jgi:superoxide reductase
MERRDFIRLGAIGVTVGLVTPTLATANAELSIKGASDIYFTKDNPGRWSGKVATHLPTIEVEKAAGTVTIKVVTPHEVKGYEHYIVKHVLLDQNYKFIEEHLFDPTKDTAAISTFKLNDYSGPIYALSLCNKHDLWLHGTLV